MQPELELVMGSLLPLFGPSELQVYPISEQVALTEGPLEAYQALLGQYRFPIEVILDIQKPLAHLLQVMLLDLGLLLAV